jgi:hypothetical protein
MMKAILKLSLALAIAPLALAQTPVDQRRPAAADGLVEIENAAGSIKVIGWNREEVQVTGALGARADGLELVSRPGRTRIQVEVEGNPNKVLSNLEIRVPAASRLQVQSHSATIDVSEVSGRVKAESVSGTISIAGSSPEVEAESVSGAITITGPAKRVRASAVNASLAIRGASGVVDAETVNGRLEVSGGAFQETRLETVNGAVRFEGELPSGATLEVETVNGPVELRLPASLGADFSISSFRGEVDSDFEMKLEPGSRRGGGKGSGKKAERRPDDDPDDERQGTELRFTTGGGGAKVAITTLNGQIALRKR